MKLFEKWIEDISISKKDELIRRFGIYNDLFFYMNLKNKNDLVTFLLDNDLFELVRSEKQVEDYYKTKVMDVFSFIDPKVDNRYRFEFPNSGFVFDPESYLGEKSRGNEIDYRYNASMQLSLFGDYSLAAQSLSLLGKEFIIKKSIPTYVSTVNCQDEQYQQFSYLIND